MRSIATWTVSILLALAFLAAAAAKLTGQAMMVSEFTLFGLPGWFLYVTGVIEVIGAVLILIPRLAGLGAALLACVMLGALAAHLTHGQAPMIAGPVVLLVLAVTVGTLRAWSPIPRVLDSRSARAA